MREQPSRWHCTGGGPLKANTHALSFAQEHSFDGCNGGGGGDEGGDGSGGASCSLVVLGFFFARFFAPLTGNGAGGSLLARLVNILVLSVFE